MSRGLGSRRLSRGLGFAAAATLGLALVLPSAPSVAQGGGCTAADTSPAALAGATFCLVNQARAQAGVPALPLDPRLTQAAVGHANQMVATDTFGSMGPDGSTPASRAAAAGYTAPVTEAIASGADDFGLPQSTVDRWMADPQTRANLLAAAGQAGGAGVSPANGGRFGANAHVYAFYVGTAPPQGTNPPPPPPPPPPPAAAKPVPGKSAVVKVISGTVIINTGLSTRSIRATTTLKGTAVVPFGATIDATKGRIDFKTARDNAGHTEHSNFYSGAFVARQKRSGSKYVTTLRLTGADFSQCPKASAATRSASAAATKKKKKKPKRLLWGNGKGKYKTEGRTASATVRGTIWLTEDRCEGTYVRVKQGVVRVRDRRSGKIHEVKAGHSILVPKR